MDENGEILLLHASKNKARPLVLPWSLYTLRVAMLQYIAFKVGYCNNFVYNIKIYNPFGEGLYILKWASLRTLLKGFSFVSHTLSHLGT